MSKLSDTLAVVQERSSQASKQPTIFDLIQRQRQQFELALPRQLNVDRFVRVAMTTLRTNPKLLACDEKSLLAALMLSAQLGLEPGGPLGYAYLVPYGRELTFIIGYKGYLDLARRSGLVASIYAEDVREGDVFQWSLGLHRDIVHHPGPQRGELTHVYAVARYREPGLEPDFIVLEREQIDSFRKRSKASSSGPWVTDYRAMALKTAVRRLATWLPLSIEMARAVAADEQVITPTSTIEAFEEMAELGAAEESPSAEKAADGSEEKGLPLES